MIELREEDKPACFGCYGYQICVSRTTPPSSCPWEQRCYNKPEGLMIDAKKRRPVITEEPIISTIAPIIDADAEQK